MSQNTLIEKIKKDAATTVADIKSTGATEVEKVQREIESEVVDLQKAHAEALVKEKNHMELVAVSRAKQAGNIALQSAKRKQINAVFASVTGEFEQQSSEEYVSFFQKFASEIIPQGIEVDHVHAPANRVEETNKILQNLNLTGVVKADQTIKAGLVVHAKDGVYDITLGRIMNEKRAELEMVVVNKVMA